VGKTTVSTNLAIYLRALHEDLPVLLVGLDDQSIIDRMFRFGRPEPGEGNLKHGWAERSLDRVIQLGQYGIQFVPPPPDTALLKARAEDPRTLRRILERTDFHGIVILDTKSDLEALTINALAAADHVILPISDFAAFEEAAKVYELLRRLHLDPGRARALLTLVDRRTRVDDQGRDLHDRLVAAIEERGWPRFETYLSRSPRVEALNSATGTPGSVLHHARGTGVHRQLRELAEEVGKLLDLGPSDGPRRTPPAAPSDESGGSLADSLKGVLLRGLGRR
jgi:cellulose biosynthesis protein BcsQ